MVTAKKTTRKVETLPPKKKVATTPKVEKVSREQFSMPVEVKEWIEQATSRMRHMQGEIERLKEENKALKSYRKFAEHRILRSEAE